MEVQKVEVYVGIYGDYCAFHEMSINIEYDVTNNIQLGDLDLKELEDHEFSEYCDYELYNAVLIDGEYYVKL